MATILEQCKIHPTPSPNQELSLPLTHFDIPFLQSDPTQRLIFFKFPTSKPHFSQTLIPHLKKSLSTTLTHFLPLAGNILLPLNSGLPENHYLPGDSIFLTIAQSDQDFTHLTGNHQRVADEFYTCLPQLPPAEHLPNFIKFPVLALQITLFPDQGICIGLTNHHAAGDESSLVNFVKSWASVNRFGDESCLTNVESLPVFDRTLVQDPGKLDSRAWNFVRKSRVLPVELPPVTFPINKVRSMFLLKRNQIQNLKKYVLAKRPDLTHVSSFILICAYAWICMVKVEVETNDSDMQGTSSSSIPNRTEEPVYFTFAADCRRRLSPPLPESYFGNCVVFVIAKSRCESLKKDEGFLIAVESLIEAVRTTVDGEKGIVASADWPMDFAVYAGKWVASVAGSPRFDMYAADFGWGTAEKYEFVHIDRERSISLSKSREFEGGFEIGLSRKKVEMDVFEHVFYRGLESMKIDHGDEFGI